MKKKTIDSKLIKIIRLGMFDTTYAKIAEASDLSLRTVADAVRTGKATQPVIDKLTEYFNPIPEETHA